SCSTPTATPTRSSSRPATGCAPSSTASPTRSRPRGGGTHAAPAAGHPPVHPPPRIPSRPPRRARPVAPVPSRPSPSRSSRPRRWKVLVPRRPHRRFLSRRLTRGWKVLVHAGPHRRFPSRPATGASCGSAHGSRENGTPDAGEQRPGSRSEIVLRETDHNPAAVLQVALTPDVAAPLLLARAVAITLVLDRDLQLGIRQVDTGDESMLVEHLVLH